MVVEQPLYSCYQPVYEEDLHPVALCCFKQCSATRILLDWYIMLLLFCYIFVILSTLDYETANDPTLSTLEESERAELYSQLASGAETGRNLC